MLFIRLSSSLEDLSSTFSYGFSGGKLTTVGLDCFFLCGSVPDTFDGCETTISLYSA